MSVSPYISSYIWADYMTAIEGLPSFALFSAALTKKAARNEKKQTHYHAIFFRGIAKKVKKIKANKGKRGTAKTWNAFHPSEPGKRVRS